MPRPFNVFWDVETEKYYIFAPDGCVLENGAPVEIKDSSGGNVDLGSSLGEELWGHVVKNSSTDETYVAFSGCAAYSGSSGESAKYNFKVASFGSSDNDGEQYDIVTSTINFGGEGGSSNPSIFEYDKTTKTVEASGFWIDGSSESVAQSLTITGSSGSSETAYLVCTATGCTSASSEMAVDGPGHRYANDILWTYALSLTPDQSSGSSKVVYNVKLYDFVGGEITRDYRGVNLPVSTGGGQDLTMAPPTVYDIVTDANGSRQFVNRYFEISGVTMEGPQGSTSWYSGEFVALQVPSGSSWGSSIVAFNSLGALQAAQRNQDSFTIPLYKFDSNGNVECDMRHMPRGDGWSLDLALGV